MKIVNLKVFKLHGMYNYDLDFNKDITFIYGVNGCGKTTMLNIIENIITGHIYKLFAYNFKFIKLTYISDNNENEQCIDIKHLENILNVTFNEHIVEISRIINVGFDDVSLTKDKDRAYFMEYPILRQIQVTFNHAYLTLNRFTTYDLDTDEDDYYARRFSRRSAYYSNNIVNSAKDDAIDDVQELIREKYSSISEQITKYNDEFRNHILKSLLDIKGRRNTIYTKGLLEYKISELQSIIDSYLNILKELKILTKHEEEEYDSYLKHFVKTYEEFINSDNKASIFNNYIDILETLQEIIKMQRIQSIAEKTELKKRLARRPLETLARVTNEFFADNQDKHIIIDGKGRIYFTVGNDNQPINIHHLSSGEKQILIFFANLIFKIKDTTSGILIVDEPELSLHLRWQKIFVDKALEVNPDIQLIFATHAPELIGKRTNKMRLLEIKT